MGESVPLGKAEGQQLEFKSSEALRRPFSISREVVAMLNARGGSVWVGVKEASGRAVEAEDVPEVEKKREDLLNHLIEAIEPRLRGEDVQVEILEQDGKRLLRVLVAAGRRGPFAQLKEGGRHYLIRVDHRIRPMTRDELFAPAPPEKGPDGSARLARLRDDVLKRDRPGMWVGLRPSPGLELDLQDKELTRLLFDPSLAGIRESGWNFLFPPTLQVKRELVGNRLRYGSDENKKTTIWKDGCIEFWTSILGLRHRVDSAREIYPLALLEYTISTMRLARAVFALRDARPDEVILDLAMTRMHGWHLPSYAPDTYGYAFEHEHPRELEEGQSLRETPLRMPWQEFEKTPDHAGYLLVRALYQDFGLTEDRIPKHYDRAARRLSFER